MEGLPTGSTDTTIRAVGPIILPIVWFMMLLEIYNGYIFGGPSGNPESINMGCSQNDGRLVVIKFITAPNIVGYQKGTLILGTTPKPESLHPKPNPNPPCSRMNPKP